MTLYSSRLAVNIKQNKIAVVNLVFCQSFIVKPFWKYANIQVLMTLKARKDFMVFKQRDLLWSGLLQLTFCTLEAMFTTTEENEVALSLFCDFGIFSQDQFCLTGVTNYHVQWEKEFRHIGTTVYIWIVSKNNVAGKVAPILYEPERISILKTMF